MKFYLSLVSVLAFTAAFQFCAFAQQYVLPQTISIDSLQTEIATDTLLSPITDTLASRQKKSDIDTVVYASGSDSLFFFVKEKKMSIYGEGKINYRKSEIKSANIFLDFNKFEIEALGVPSDTSAAEFVGTPVLTEDGEVYEGKRMKYNFKTGQGSLSAADTELEGAFYVKSVALIPYRHPQAVRVSLDGQVHALFGVVAVAVNHCVYQRLPDSHPDAVEIILIEARRPRQIQDFLFPLIHALQRRLQFQLHTSGLAAP